jgi:hypothetical protein
MQYINKDATLRVEHMKIQLNEKLNQLEGVNLRIDHLQNVEIKGLELQKKLRQREIDDLKELIRSTLREIDPDGDGIEDAEFTIQ